MVNNILVTGGYGLVGQGIQSFIRKNKHSDNFIFLSSKECDLRDKNEVNRIFVQYKPNYVIHLAAHVGGVFKNIKQPVEMYRDNIIINDNIMELCRQFKVEKLVSCLSTCIFPDKTTYPIDETMIHNGSPHYSNESYSYAKRMIDVMNRSYNKEYGCNFTAVIPTNIYGPHDNFSLEDGHVIPSLIHKAFLAKKYDTEFVICGSGRPLRQFIFSEDLAELIIYVMKNYNSCEPIILSVDEEDEVSINDISFTIAASFNINYSKIVYDTTKEDGQYKKTASNKKLKTLLPNYKFKSLKNGIYDTCKWFEDNYNTCRK